MLESTTGFLLHADFKENVVELNLHLMTTFALTDSFFPISSRKRRKQTHVPVESKDDKYWARRMKNNEAAKRSRDMRIKREKVVFEENSRLEQQNRDLRSELVSRASNPENDLLITRRAYVPSLISS